MSKPTPEEIAARFGVPTENVKRQFSKNATQLRAMAARAGSGAFRGKTGAEWSALADMAEGKSK